MFQLRIHFSSFFSRVTYDHAQNQEDQREGQGDVLEEGYKTDGKCREQSSTAGHNPHLVTVPDGPIDVQQQTRSFSFLSELWNPSAYRYLKSKPSRSCTC